MNHRRTVLIITYFFPPVGGGGVMRMLKFAKYLPQYGWQPIILTASINGLVNDPSLLDELGSDTRIFRTKPSWITEWKFRLLRHTFAQRTARNGLRTTLPPRSKNFLRRLTSFLERLKKPIESWVLLPDQHIIWVRPATRLAEEILRRHSVDAIVTSGPPHSTHLIGRTLTRKYHRPWLVDFRDDWFTNPLFMPSSAIGRKIVERLERSVINTANVLTTVTPPLRDKIAIRYPTMRGEKFVTLWNGFDPSDFERAPKLAKRQTELQLVFTGSYGRHRETDSFFQATARLKNQRPDFFSALRVTFIGQFTDSKKRWREMFGTHVSFQPYLSHHESIVKMQQADALLLFLSRQEDGAIAMPGKIFEYLAARRPIVAFTCLGILKDFVAQHRFGWTADIEKADEIYTLLVTILEQWIRQGRLDYAPDEKVLNQFNRQRLTGEFADLLNAMMVVRTQR